MVLGAENAGGVGSPSVSMAEAKGKTGHVQELGAWRCNSWMNPVFVFLGRPGISWSYSLRNKYFFVDCSKSTRLSLFSLLETFDHAQPVKTQEGD